MTISTRNAEFVPDSGDIVCIASNNRLGLGDLTPNLPPSLEGQSRDRLYRRFSQNQLIHSSDGALAVRFRDSIMPQKKSRYVNP